MLFVGSYFSSRDVNQTTSTPTFRWNPNVAAGEKVLTWRCLLMMNQRINASVLLLWWSYGVLSSSGTNFWTQSKMTEPPSSFISGKLSRCLAVSLSFCRCNRGETDAVNRTHERINEDNLHIWEAEPGPACRSGFPPKPLLSTWWNAGQWAGRGSGSWTFFTLNCCWAAFKEAGWRVAFFLQDDSNHKNPSVKQNLR